MLKLISLSPPNWLRLDKRYTGSDVTVSLAVICPVHAGKYDVRFASRVH